jgi:hypothetical protein
MTAIEMATALGRQDLFAILSPEILYHVPHSILATLQTHFHNLIRNNLATKTHELAVLRLPDLAVLTELEIPIMWFPLKPQNSLRSNRMYPEQVSRVKSTEVPRKRVRVRLNIPSCNVLN